MTKSYTKVRVSQSMRGVAERTIIEPAQRNTLSSIETRFLHGRAE